jgi:hypothetical protein
MADSVIIWRYREGVAPAAGGDAPDLSGYEIEALDGSVGKVDEALVAGSRAYLVVDTGPWIFGKKVILPVGVIERIDVEHQKVWVDRTREEIKSAPELDESDGPDERHREELGKYYGGLADGSSYRETAARLRGRP